MKRVLLDENTIVMQDQAKELIAVDNALTRLAQFDSKKSRIVEMKFFGGLTFEEIATVENVSTRTIEREWQKAKAWLRTAIG